MLGYFCYYVEKRLWGSIIGATNIIIVKDFENKMIFVTLCMYVCMYGHHILQSMDQPGKVANPARGQLNREDNIPLSPCVPENLVSRDGFYTTIPVLSTRPLPIVGV